MKNIRKKIYFFMVCLMIMFFILISCEEKIFTLDVDCDECYTDKPDSADLVLEFSDKYFKYGEVLINVFEGNIENNKKIFIDTIKTELFYLYVPVNRYYSISANYTTKDNQRYIVVNGTELKVKRVSEECEETCWVTTGQNIDLKVKFTKYFE